LADDIKDINDLAAQATANVKELSADAQKFAKFVKEAGKGFLDLTDIADVLVQQMEDLPDNILKGSDLINEMKKNTELLNKVQKAGADYLEKSLKEQISNVKNRETLTKQALKNWDKQIAAMKKQKKLGEDIKLNWANVNTIMNSLGSAITHPAQAGDRILESISALPNRIKQASDKAGGFDKLMASIAKNAKVFAKGGLIAIGLMAILGPIIMVWKALKQLWSFLDSKVMPAFAALNKALGAGSEGMEHLRKQAVKTGVQFEMLGKTFQEGYTVVTNISSALMSAEIPDKYLSDLLKMSEYVGAGTEATGKFGLFLKKTTGSLRDSRKIMNEAALAAESYGVPWNQVRKDMIENTNILARFGTRNTLVMAEAAAKARHYGLTIENVNEAFGDQMDTFSGSAEAAAKLNTIFGTNINSMKLMMETDPTKRLEMLREELLNQGRTWEKLSVFERNAIAQSLGVDKTQAALILSSEKRRKQLQSQAKQQEHMNKINEEWEKGLGNTKETLLPLIPLVENMMRAFARFSMKLLFGVDIDKAMGKTAKSITEVASSITGGLQSATRELNKEGFTGIFDTIKNFNGREFVNTLKDIGAALKDIAKAAKDVKEIVGYIEKAYKITETATSALSPQGLIKKGAESEMLMNMYNMMTMNPHWKPWDPFGINEKKAEDALITKKGEVIKFDPQDNIMATKANINPAMMGNQKKQEEIIHVHLHMDGKEIAETQVRRARLG